MTNQAHAQSSQLVILVGGRGTRLGSATTNTPKPLMPITHDAVFLDYLIYRAEQQGFSDILLLAGHKGEQVKSRYDGRKAGNSTIHTLIETTPAGTGGAFRLAMDHLNEMFLAINGDTLFDVNFRRLLDALVAHPAWLGVLGLRTTIDAKRYGSVTTQKSGTVLAFHEKQQHQIQQSSLISAGAYALRKCALERISVPSSIETDLFPTLAADGLLGSIQYEDEYFLDIGLPETLEQARHDLPAKWPNLKRS